MSPKGKTEIMWLLGVSAILIVSATVNIAFIDGHTSNIAQPTDLQTVPANSTIINVTGSQWVWEFQIGNKTYFNSGNSHSGALPLIVNHTYTFEVTSKDVIHDLSIPEFGVQSYAVPGHENQVSFKPTKVGYYYFECVEYCGFEHYEMRGYIDVTSGGAS